MASTHALLSPSSAERWMTCPGSVAMSLNQPNPSSKYSDEGTAAHFLAAYCLQNTSHPTAHISKYIGLLDGEAGWLGESFDSSFEVTADMAGHVNSYVQYVLELVKSTGGVLLVEQALPIGSYTGEEGAEGTGDTIILTADEIIVVDLKFGAGVYVDAKDNKQMQIYALGAYSKYSLMGDFKQVRTIIHQPRISGPSEWGITIEELLVFADEVATAAVKVWATMNANECGSDLVLVPSNKGCRWCRAKAVCPALASYVQDTIAADFEDITEGTDIIAPLETNDGITLSLKMQACDLIEDWIKAIRGRVEYDLLQGIPVPNYKLVQGRQGSRAWTNSEHAEALLKSMKLKVEEMYDMKLISPTSAEKLMKAKVIGPRQWPKIEQEISRSEGKPSVAPESDKRPALVLNKPEDDFKDETQADLI